MDRVDSPQYDQLCYTPAWELLPAAQREAWERQITGVAIPPLMVDSDRTHLYGTEVDLRALELRISRDPLLASKVLAVANSASVGLSKRVTSLERAIVHLGVSLIHSIVVIYQMELMLKQWPSYPREHFKYVRRWSAGASVLMEHFAMVARCPDPPMLTTAALLTRLGTLMLGVAQPMPDMQYRQAPHELARLDLEWRTWGISSPALGQQLAHTWGLPAPLPELIGSHMKALGLVLDDVQADREQVLLCAAVALASAYIANAKMEPRIILDRVNYVRLKDNLKRFNLHELVLNAWTLPKLKRELAIATD